MGVTRSLGTTKFVGGGGEELPKFADFVGAQAEETVSLRELLLFELRIV